MEKMKSEKDPQIEKVECIELGPDEWEKARALRVHAVTDSPTAFGTTPEEAEAIPEAEWRRRLEERQYLFAQQGNELVGMACAVQEKNQKVRHIAYVYSAYIKREVRGKGIGRQLLEQLIARVKQNHPEVIKLSLNVAATQETALQLYESLGFEKIGLLKKELCVDGEYIDAWAMEKFI